MKLMTLSVIYVWNGEFVPKKNCLLLYLRVFLILKNMYSCVMNLTHSIRMTSGKSFIYSFSCQFFNKLTSYPSDVWVKIFTRMNVDVFQYKILVIPFTQDNHKSMYVVLGLQHVLNNGKNIGNCDWPCIIWKGKAMGQGLRVMPVKAYWPWPGRSPMVGPTPIRHD